MTLDEIEELVEAARPSTIEEEDDLRCPSYSDYERFVQVAEALMPKFVKVAREARAWLDEQGYKPGCSCSLCRDMRYLADALKAIDEFKE